MSEIPKLWCLHKGTRAIYFVVGPINCNGCSNNIPFGYQAFHLMDWNPTSPAEFIFCENCIKKGIQPKGPLPPNWFMQERRTSIVVEGMGGLPGGSFPVPMIHQGLSESKSMSSFMAASQKIAPSVHITDKTKYAGRAGYTFLDDNAPVLLGHPDSEFISAKDKVLSVDDGLSLLDNLTKERGDKE